MSQFIVYTDLDSLWDTRRAILETLLPEGETWEEHYEEQYTNRKIDFFAKPELGITQEKYLEAFRNRDIRLFEKRVFPSSLLPKILMIILDIENFIGKPINVGTINFVINIYPYELDEHLKEVLTKFIEDAIFYNKDVRLVSVPYKDLTPDYFRVFTHIFKYDALGENSQPLLSKLQESPIPSCKFFVPDLYIKDPIDGFLADPEEVIHKMSVVVAPSITIIPMKHAVYDSRYKTE